MKTGVLKTFSATNAMLNTNLVGAMSGQGRQVAGSETGNEILMPAIKIVKAGTPTVQLTVTGSTVEPNTVKIVGMSNNGAMSTNTYELKTDAASEFGYKISDTGLLTLPTAGTTGTYADDQFVITYQRKVTSGYAVVNRSDKYPQTVRLLLKVLYVDPCSAD